MPEHARALLQVVKLVREVARRASCAFVLVSHMEALASTLHPARTVTLERARPEDDDCHTRATDLGRLPLAARACRRACNAVRAV